MDQPDYTSMGWMVGVAVAVGNFFSAIASKMFDFFLQYRKTADAGQLAIIQAQQAGQAKELEQTRGEVTVLRRDVDDCHDKHERCTVENAKLQGEVASLRQLVIKDTQDTGALAARVDTVEKKQANGGQA